MTPPVPATIGPFVIRRVMGRGGMGVVYEAAHRDTGERVALKTVRLVDTGMLTGLRREIHALSRLDHPGIVRIAAHGMDEGLPWYAMSFLEGPTLRYLLLDADRPTATETAASAPGASAPTAVLPVGSGDPTERLAARPAAPETDAPQPRGAPVLAVSRALAIAERLCGALGYLHGEGVVHRDLKPDNVFILPGDRPVIVDFGLAGMFAGASGRESVEGTGEASGTARYMAPEQARGDPVDARADIYALGCILYELLTGDPPFSAPNALGVLYLHATAEPDPPSRRDPSLPRDVDALVLRLLAKDPAARIGHADTVARMLVDLGAPAEPAPVAVRPYLYRPRLAGRGAERKRLLDAFDRAAEGDGVVAGIGGESGVGKTRLALEVASDAKRRGARVVTGDCAVLEEEGAATSPLAPLSRLLVGIADRCRELGREGQERILGPRGKVLLPYEPALGRLPGADAWPAPAELPPAEARLRVMEDLLQTIREHAREAPVLLLVDDAQWADEMTLDFLAWLLRGRRLRGCGLMVLFTYRREEAGGVLQDLLDAPGVVDVALDRLGADEVAGIVTDMLAWSDPEKALTEALHRHSEGNPFFVAEFLRAAVAEGLLRRDERGAWVNAEGAHRFDALPLPRSVSQLSGRRLARLSPEALSLARAAATLGRHASLPLLAQTLALTESDVIPPLAELFSRHVLEDADGGGVRFLHDKIRETAYQEIPLPEKAALHAGAAAALEAGVDAASRAEEAGRHWELAGKADRAMAAYLAAARAASAQHAHAKAERSYRAYLALAPDGPARIDARLALAELLAVVGRGAEQGVQSSIARDEARRHGDRSRLALALRQLGTARRREGSMEEAKMLVAEALRIHADLEERVQLGLAQGELATMEEETGRLAEGAALFADSIRTLRHERVPQALAQTLIAYGGHLRVSGQPAAAAAAVEEALATFRSTHDRRGEAMALGSLANLRMDQGDLGSTRALYEAAEAIFHEVGDRRSVATAHMNQAGLAMYEGRIDAAEALFASAERTYREIGETRNLPQLLTNVAEMLQRLGRDQEAFDVNEEALAIARTTGDVRREAAALSRRGQLLLKRGDDAGRHALAVSAARHFELQNGGAAGVDLETLADYELMSGLVEDAARHAAQARASYRDAGRHGLEVGALVTQARIQRIGFGAYDLAQAHLDEAGALLRPELDPELELTYLCEAGHLALVRGQSAGPLLAKAELLIAGWKPGPDSTTAQVVGFLRAAIAAKAAGQPLLRGEAPDQLPASLRERLSRAGVKAAGDAEGASAEPP